MKTQSQSRAEIALALEVAAAGGYHVLIVSRYGEVRSSLAEQLRHLLPMVETEPGNFTQPSMVIVYPSATPSDIAGRGDPDVPGAAALADGGVLFVKDAPECSPRILDMLRAPLDTGELTTWRAGETTTTQARFQLVLGSKPCPCGSEIGPSAPCSCAPMQRRRYLARMSGPLLDRIDIQLQLPTTRHADVHALNEASRERVPVARQRAQQRLAGTSWQRNAQVPGKWIRDYLASTPKVVTELYAALDAGAISLRGADQVLRLSLTLADLNDRPRPAKEDIAQAMRLRNGFTR